MTWRVARSLDQLLAQLNMLAPNRSRASDGSIGDAAHQLQGSASDHNPWYGPGIVTARDFTHDPRNGLDCNKLAAALIASRDPRIKYIIWQGRICDSRAQSNPWTWQPSSGHYQHLHLSVMANASADDARPWSLPGLIEEDDMTPQELLGFKLYGRRRNDKTPKGYDEYDVTLGTLLMDIHAGMYQGHGWNLSWGAGVLPRLDELKAKSVAGGPVVNIDYDQLAEKVVARLGDSIADKVADKIANRMAS